jgi:hypothetical protein
MRDEGRWMSKNRYEKSRKVWMRFSHPSSLIDSGKVLEYDPSNY